MFSKQVALIVDHSVQVQRIVMRILSDDLNFARVLTASNGKQALQLFETENIDWILSEWAMPVMGGQELIQAIRKHPRGRLVPFILMTNHADKQTLETAMASGVSDFVAKPFSAAILVQKIKRISNALERHVAARIAPKEVYPAQVVFPGGAKYDAELVDISTSGCLLRTAWLQQGGTVFDDVTLTLKLASDTIRVMANASRISKDTKTAKPGNHVLVAFEFQANAAVLTAIKMFISQLQLSEAEA